MSAFVGKWELFESNNFENLLEAIGLQGVDRKFATATNRVLTFQEQGPECMSMTVTTCLRNYEIIFKFGRQFAQQSGEGLEVLSTFRKEGENKLIEDQIYCNTKLLVEREVIGNELHATITYDGIVATRKYRRVDP